MMSCLPPPFAPQTIIWYRTKQPVPYHDAVSLMESYVHAMYHDKTIPPLLWLLEHPPLYSQGMSAVEDDAPRTTIFPLYKSGRGGGYTYHGPGQRILYAMMSLRHKDKPSMPVSHYIRWLHGWCGCSLARLGVVAVRRGRESGLWVSIDGCYKKIVSFGIRMRHGISFHGISINAHCSLDPFRHIRPCGYDGDDVTSLCAMRSSMGSSMESPSSLRHVDNALLDVLRGSYASYASSQQLRIIQQDSYTCPTLSSILSLS